MLKAVMPIERAQMRLKITASKEGRKLKEKLAKVWTTMESEEWDGSTIILVRYFPIQLLLIQLTGAAINFRWKFA